MPKIFHNNAQPPRAPGGPNPEVSAESVGRGGTRRHRPLGAKLSRRQPVTAVAPALTSVAVPGRCGAAPSNAPPPPATPTTGTPTTAPPTTPPPTTTPTPPPTSSSWNVTMGAFSFTPSTINAPAGTITVMLTNSGVVPHTFTIAGLVDVRLAPGGMQTVSFQAAPGSYRIYCAEPGHAAAGMTGTLIVTAPGAPPPPTPTTTAADTTTTAEVAGATKTLTPKATVASKAIACAP